MDKITELFTLEVIRRTVTFQDRVHIYVNAIRSGEQTIDDVIKYEAKLDCFAPTIMDNNDLFKLMLQYGYSINDVRVLNGEEPVDYGGKRYIQQ